MKTIYVIAFVALSSIQPFTAHGAPLVAFTTSTAGNGNLSTWSGAGANSGLAAADAICQSRATAASLANPELFVAWMSSTADDAYCRAHGLSGKKVNNCEQASLPVGAGPWVRTDGISFMATIDQAIGNGLVFSTLNHDEFGMPLSAPAYALTGSTQQGALDTSTTTCSNWSSAASATVTIGYSNISTNGWGSNGSTNCNVPSARLICLQKGNGSALPALSRPSRREAFVSDLSFSANLGASPLAGATTGVAAGDAICRNLATAANLYLPQSFKAFLSDGTMSAVNHFQFDGPWLRHDGLKFADNLAQIAGGTVNLPLNVTQTGLYLGNYGAWTGATAAGGIGANHCNSWTSTAGIGNTASVFANGPGWAGNFPNTSCATMFTLFCLSDSDIIFHNGVE
jgi:hypothetical protein